MAANAILDTAFTVMIEACVNGNVEVLQHRLRKMLSEERYHFLHGRSWLRSGIEKGPLDEAWRQALEWFGPPDGDTAALHKAGMLAMGPAELKARLEEQLDTKAPAMELSWTGWNARRRRTQPGAVDARTFGMLRGLEEKRFAPAAKASD